MASVVVDALHPQRVKLKFQFWPQSVNNVTTVVRGRKIKTKRGRDFLANVCSEILVARSSTAIPHFDGKVAVVIKLHAPTRRRYDIDNMSKAVLDSLTESQIWNDDQQVALLTLKKCKVKKGGEFSVSIRELPPVFGDEDDE